MGAGGGEGAGDGEEDCFFIGGEVGDGDGLELASGVEVGEGGVGELVTHGNGGGDWRGVGGEREFCGGGFCEEAVAEGEIFEWVREGMEGFRRKERGFDGGSGSGGNGGGGEEFGECKRGCHFGGANNGSG